MFIFHQNPNQLILFFLFSLYLSFSLSLSLMGASPGELREELVTKEKWNNDWRMNWDVGEATEGLENELWRR